MIEKNLLTIDSDFTNHYSSLLDVQKGIIDTLKNYPFDLSKTEITDAIIARMDAFWGFHINNSKVLLDRQTNVVAADFFTETCLLFIKLYFNGRYKVKSEVNINTGNKNSIKPDITIWKEDKLVAVIEIKVNNGYKGKNIMEHLIEREKQIIDLYPNTYFSVIAFWNFFDIDADGWIKKYIGLKWWDEKNGHPKTDATVELLLQSIEEYLRNKQS